MYNGDGPSELIDKYKIISFFAIKIILK